MLENDPPKIDGDIIVFIVAFLKLKHKNITIEDIQSDKMIKKENGYFINPYSFKEYGGSDIFFLEVLIKQK